MSGIIVPGQVIDPFLKQIEPMLQRITMLSEQVNYLLREIYKTSDGEHSMFKRNIGLANDVRQAIQLEAEGSRLVKEEVDTPEFTREQIKKLNAGMNK
jgi:phosphoenolpyruvate-protein kinase (PTS system EI component)